MYYLVPWRGNLISSACIYLEQTSLLPFVEFILEQICMLSLCPGVTLIFDFFIAHPSVVIACEAFHLMPIAEQARPVRGLRRFTGATSWCYKNKNIAPCFSTHNVSVCMSHVSISTLCSCLRVFVSTRLLIWYIFICRD